MRYFVIFIIAFGLMGCSDSAKNYIQQIQALEESNQRLKNTVSGLQKKASEASEQLFSSKNEIEQLRKKNEALEKMSEERIRKFWSMYE
jgi:uncharacterized coiled-coil DUF342 family protein